jgi:uncharacterized repeat protein (TIGR02543 family)
MGAVVVVTAGLIFSGATAAYAAGATSTDGLFTFSADPANVLAGATIIDSTGSGAVTIPPTVTSGSVVYVVTAIGDLAFENNLLESVMIPDSVITIGASAFTNNLLTSVTIPNSVTTIGDFALTNNRLVSVTIPNSVITIGDFAFAQNRLASVEIPDSVTTIGNFAFNNNLLASVEISNSVTTIGNFAFARNALTSVTIPNGVTTIGEFAFNINLLASVTIPGSVITIGNFAFADNLLASVEIPDSVITIGDFAFSNNLLESVAIPGSVATIGNFAFADNPSAWFLVPASITDVVAAPLCSSIARTVFFISNEGSPVSRAIACAPLAVPVPVAPTRTGYTLIGWSATQSGGVLFDFTSLITTSTILFAQWSAQSHVVTFDSQGGSVVADGFYSTGGSVTLPAAPTRAGFTFTGWFAAASGGAALVSQYSPPGVGAITVFAQWSPLKENKNLKKDKGPKGKPPVNRQ